MKIKCRKLALKMNVLFLVCFYIGGVLLFNHWVNYFNKNTITLFQQKGAYFGERALQSKESVAKKEGMVIFPKYLGPGAGNNLIHIDENDKRYMELRHNISQADVNIYLSDIIGMKRILNDLRPDECKKIRYPGNLPGISIVITLPTNLFRVC
jgi:hypothetical protein